MRRTVLGWTSLAAAVFVTVTHVAYRGLGSQFAIFDFAAYYYAAVRLTLGHDLYPQLTNGFVVGDLGLYFYPPPVALLFIPFTVLPVEAASVVWALMLFAVAAAVIVSLTRHLDAEQRPLAAALIVVSIPLQLEIANGNLTLVTLGLALASWRYRSREVVAGGFLAFGFVLKLMPAILFPFFIAAGRWRVALAMAAALTALVAVTWPWLGTAWLEYLQLIRTLASAPRISAETHDMVPHFGSLPTAYVLPAIALVVAVYCGWIARRQRSSEDRAFTIALAAAPLVSPFVFYTYLVLSIPLAIDLCFRERSAVARVLALIAIALMDIPSPPALSDTQPLLGLFLLIALGLRTLARGRSTTR